jgi:predicted RNA-binding protein with PUA-like domain
MAKWLLKTEPDTYSYHDLVKEGNAVWDGVTNNWALKFMRSIKKGDQVMIYHSGKEKRIAGLAEVTSDPYPDPTKSNPSFIVFNLRAKQKLKGRVTLQHLKSDHHFAEFLLVKHSRLSVLPVEEKLWAKILSLDAAD